MQPQALNQHWLAVVSTECKKAILLIVLKIIILPANKLADRALLGICMYLVWNILSKVIILISKLTVSYQI